VIALPPALRWWAHVPGGEAWLERLPRLVADCVAQWELELGEPYAAAFSFVAQLQLREQCLALGGKSHLLARFKFKVDDSS
jgi:hypothetical protein